MYFDEEKICCLLVFKDENFETLKTILGESWSTNFKGDLETFIPFLMAVHSRSKDETRLEVPNFILELSRRSSQKENRIKFWEGRPLIIGHNGIKANRKIQTIIGNFFIVFKVFYCHLIK